MTNKKMKRINKKRVFKNDIGNKVKVIALNDMNIHNRDYDFLYDEFINDGMIDYNSPIDLYDEIN